MKLTTYNHVKHNREAQADISFTNRHEPKRLGTTGLILGRAVILISFFFCKTFLPLVRGTIKPLTPEPNLSACHILILAENKIKLVDDRRKGSSHFVVLSWCFNIKLNVFFVVRNTSLC